MLCAMCERTARNELRYYAITVTVSGVWTTATQYFTVQPYGVVLAVETALPASTSFNATRT